MNKIKDYYRDEIEKDLRKYENEFHGYSTPPHKREKSEPAAVLLTIALLAIFIIALFLIWLSKEALFSGIMKIVNP